MRHVLLVVAIVAGIRGTSHASCAPTPSQPIHLAVDTCVAVDKAKGSILIEGRNDADDAIKVWVPATEKASCSVVKPGALISGTLDLACCDGDASPPCTIGTSSVLTKLTVQKPIKELTRAELEAEVIELRAENAKLRAKAKAENARLEKEIGVLHDKLK